MATQIIAREPVGINLKAGHAADVVDAAERPDWLTKFYAKGWTVVPKAISREKALAYADRGYDWLESWNLGFDRKDRSTYKTEKLPWYARSGLYARYGIGHEQFVWDIKSEPGVIGPFEKIWGTHKLLVSFDGVNLSIPEKERPKTHPMFAPWSHVDQSPLRRHFDCVQGIVNLLPNGPDDGGLMVLEGSSQYYNELWDRFDHKKPAEGWHEWAQQNVDEEMCQWLESKGCKWVKVCAEPGDLLLWDSRCIHYGAAPSSTNSRFAAYVCYKPEDMVPQEIKNLRRELFEKKEGTTHDPAAPRHKPRLPPEEHASYAEALRRPLQKPVLSKRAQQLAGLVPY
ncbi:Phytanoyl-CoA dioxygenase [Niveomyces insectorum RCEF 264]|uniref:Phytanoyl-CoA dioxygenase n=1 Tax=Niveomyces insectorum RCEF 264 TaxID=1081102 RepID=A0A167Y003_9HYPO|nr:Phytanoyl-CoA dioxygenase [Niveomyces insectorum RCEF 264]